MKCIILEQNNTFIAYDENGEFIGDAKGDSKQVIPILSLGYELIPLNCLEGQEILAKVTHLR